MEQAILKPGDVYRLFVQTGLNAQHMTLNVPRE
jgi:hypothetical protein